MIKVHRKLHYRKSNHALIVCNGDFYTLPSENHHDFDDDDDDHDDSTGGSSNDDRN